MVSGDPQTRRSPHEAGSESKLGGDAFGEHNLLARWALVGAAVRDPSLSRGDLATLWAVADRIGKDGTAWPGYGRLAKDTNLHRATVGRAIAKLVAGGYLVKNSGGLGKPNIYRLGSRKAATSSSDATRRKDATQVGARVRRGVGAGMRPKPASLNLPKEPTQKHPRKAQAPADRFGDFWKVYPRKEAKAPAEKAWRRLKADPLADHVIADLVARMGDGGPWKDLEKRFIPLPATYLNGRRWEDEWAPAARAGGVAGEIQRDARNEDELEAANRDQLARFGMGGGA